MDPDRKQLFYPFFLTAILIIADQITKLIIMNTIELHTIGFSAFDGFLRIVHTRNLGIAFSIGRGFSETLRSLLFILIPLAIMAGLVVYYFRTDELTRLQRWAVAGILGGGLGNQVDRVFRSSGVVDFIDIKFFGIFGLERWPVFNIADAGIVVSGIVLVISIIFQKGIDEHEQKS
jgi:signal peptidase II